MIGTTAGPYRILDVISVGGMGTVYRAEHSLIGRTAAVKVLHPEMSTNPDIINRFFNEAKATTSIKHPGIVEIYDFGYLPSGHAFIVMEFLEGQTMAAWNKQRGTYSEGEAAVLLRGVCSALAAAHAKGIVHRDLKPDNIFLVPDADSSLGVRAKLLDFGIAKLTDVGLAGSATKTGAVMGTPTYMSPEQCKGTGDVDLRADLYSIGCMFYEMVAGRPPFVERGAGELIGAHLFVQPDPPSRYMPCSPETEQLIMALLAKNPAQRPQTAIELGQRLSAIAQRTGYTSSTSWEQRPSVAGMMAAGPSASPNDATRMGSGVSHAATPRPQSSHGSQPGHGSSPGYGAAPGTTPVPSYPMISYGTTPTPVPGSADKPTTLSGAAAEAKAAGKKSSSKVILGIAAVAILGGGIAIAAVMGSKKSGDTANASAPTAPTSSATTTAPPPAPTPAPVATTPAAPASAPTPAPTPVAPTPAPAPTPVAPTPDPVAVTTEPAKTDPAKVEPAKTDPKTTKTTKSTKTTKTTKTTKSTKDPLLETDL